MSEPANRNNIRIEGSAVGSAIVSGDGNTIYVIHQAVEQQVEDLTSEVPAEIGPNPYKGLAAFQERDAANYFGREGQIERLWQLFQDLYEQSGNTTSVPRFLPILGPSGCGKSSLARAGLIPELARRPLPGKAKMRVVVMVPGESPVRSLAGILAKLTRDDQTPEAIKKQSYETALREAAQAERFNFLQTVAETLPDIQSAPLVVLVDQFEEVYSLCQDGGDRKAFIENLLYAAGSATGYVTVVMTLRSDFLAETQRHPLLNQAIGTANYNPVVQAMTPDEMRRAIAEPAEQAGHPLEDATVDLLLNDTAGREGALPLLQFALTRIWEELRTGKPPAETYREMGGVGGALADKAQAIYECLNGVEQDIARRMFLGLVQLGEGTRDTRRRADIESLIASQDNPAMVRQVVNRFSAPGARLVSLSGEADKDLAEVTHEALFSHWTLLNDWLDSSREEIRFQRRLAAAARYWDEQQRPQGLLWRSPDLDLLQAFTNHSEGELSQLSVAFFEASNGAQKREKQGKRLGIAALVVGLLTTTALSIFSGYKVQQAAHSQMHLYESRAQELAKTDSVASLTYGLAAVGMGRSAFIKFPQLGSQARVTTAVLDEPNRRMQASYVASHEGMVLAVAMSADGDTIVSGSADHTLRLWDRQGAPIGKPLQGHDGEVWGVAISDEGDVIVSGGEDGTVRLWNRQGQPMGTFEGHELPVRSVAISADGGTIVSGGDDGVVRLWDRDGTVLGTFLAGPEVKIWTVAINADGGTIVSGGDDGKLRVWDRTGTVVGESEPVQGSSLASVAIGGTGLTTGPIIVSGSTDGSVQLWSREAKPIGAPWQGHSETVWGVAISEDGKTVASGSLDATVRLWTRDEKGEGKPLGEPLRDHLSGVLAIALSRDGQTLMSGSVDNTVRFWDRQQALVGGLFEGHEDLITSMAMSEDGQTLVSKSTDRPILLWDRQGNLIGELFERVSVPVIRVGLSGDGQTVVSGNDDGTVRLWDRAGNAIGQPFVGHGAPVPAVAISRAGKTVVSGGSDKTVRLWDRAGNAIGQPFEGHEGTVWSVAISADGRTIVSGGDKGTVRLWDREGNALGEPLEGHVGEVWSVAISADGQTIVSGGNDGTVRLWDREGNALGEPLEGHESVVWSVVISADGQTIVSGSWDNTVRRWDRAGNQLGAPLEGHSELVNAVAMTLDGQTIASGSADGTVRFWPMWLVEKGWVAYSCDRLQGYLKVFSEGDETAREARRTCDRYAWK